jgi:putative flippase GtrA
MNRTFIQRVYPLAMFCTLGTINMGLYFLFFTIFWNFLHINYLVAVSLTFMITAAFQFFANRKVTFKASGNVYHQMWKYFILLGINYLITLFIMHSVVSTFELSPYIGLFVSTAFSATISFLLFKFWVFRHTSAAL